MQNLLRPFRGALRSRARKSADKQDSTKNGRGCTTDPRRAVDCALCLALRLSVSALKRSRARKGADGRIPAEKPGQHDTHRRAVDCAPYLTLYASGVKDSRRSFWSAVLQHRFWFGLRDDFHVVQNQSGLNSTLQAAGNRRMWKCAPEGRAPLCS